MLVPKKQTLNASRISSSESVSFIFLAIIVRNSGVRQQLASSGVLSREMSHTREVDSAIVVGVHLVDHVLQLRLGRVLAERAHDGAQLLGRDLSCKHL